MYLYNPIPYDVTADITRRVCVDECPSIDANNNLKQVNCIGATGVSCTYTVTFTQDGTAVGTPTAAGTTFLGYQSTVQLGRVCVPETAVINAFTGFSTDNTSAASSLSSTLD